MGPIYQPKPASTKQQLMLIVAKLLDVGWRWKYTALGRVYGYIEFSHQAKITFYIPDTDQLEFRLFCRNVTFTFEGIELAPLLLTREDADATRLTDLIAQLTEEWAAPEPIFRLIERLSETGGAADGSVPSPASSPAIRTPWRDSRCLYGAPPPAEACRNGQPGPSQDRCTDQIFQGAERGAGTSRSDALRTANRHRDSNRSRPDQNDDACGSDHTRPPASLRRP